MEGNQIDPAERKYRIYGKFGKEKRFKPMDLSKGCQVINLIYASCLTEEEKNRFMERDAKLNPEWTFEPRPL